MEFGLGRGHILQVIGAINDLLIGIDKKIVKAIIRLIIDDLNIPL